MSSFVFSLVLCVVLIFLVFIFVILCIVAKLLGKPDDKVWGCEWERVGSV